jgi:hypothetical protein
MTRHTFDEMISFFVTFLRYTSVPVAVLEHSILMHSQAKHPRWQPLQGVDISVNDRNDHMCLQLTYMITSCIGYNWWLHLRYPFTVILRGMHWKNEMLLIFYTITYLLCSTIFAISYFFFVKPRCTFFFKCMQNLKVYCIMFSWEVHVR